MRTSDALPNLNPKPNQPAGVILHIDLTEKGILKKINWKGSTVIGLADLSAAIEAHEGGVYDPGTLHKDMTKIAQLYRQLGYYFVKVNYTVKTLASHQQKVGAALITVNDEIELTADIQPGDLVGVRDIFLAGNTSVDAATLREQLQIRAGGFFHFVPLIADALDDDAKRLERFYTDRGFQDVAVVVGKTHSVDWERPWFLGRTQFADVNFNITEGPKYTIGNVVVHGNEAITTPEILDVIHSKPGAAFSIAALVEYDPQAICSLYARQGCPSVKASFLKKHADENTRPNQYDLTLEIQERPSETAAIGRFILAAGLGGLVALALIILRRALVRRHQPRYSIRMLLALTIFASLALYGYIRAQKIESAWRWYEQKLL